MLTPLLPSAQRSHRVGPRRTLSRNVRGQSGYNEQQDGRGQERGRIYWTHPKQLRAEDTHNSESEGNAYGNARADHE